MEDKDAIATTASNSNKLNHLLETLIRHDEAAGHRLQESQDHHNHRHHHHRHHYHQQQQPQHRELLDLERPYREPSPAQFAMAGGGNPTAIVSGKRKASEAININANPTNHTGNNNNNNNGSSNNNNNGLQRLPQHLQSEWSPDAVSCLLDTYADKFARGKGFLRNSDWEDVASTLNARESSRVPKTIRQCRDKVDSLKKRYKMEKKKAADSGSSRISWPLFGKLDELLGYQSRVSRIPGGVDAGVKVPFAEPSLHHHHHDNQHHGHFPDAGYRHERHGLTPEEMYHMPHRKKGKMMMVEDTDAMSEEEDSESSSQQMRNDKYSSRTGSLDEGSHSRREHDQAADSEKASRRRKTNSVDPVQALADAIVGFSDVFARIEMAKMEIYTKMKLEIAKLEMESSGSDTSSSSSSET